MVKTLKGLDQKCPNHLQVSVLIILRTKKNNTNVLFKNDI